MKRNWLIGLAVFAFVIVSACVNHFAGIAQTPSPSPTESIGVPVAPIPIDPSLPTNRPAIPTASPSPSPTTSGSPTPTASPTIPTTPTLPVPLPVAPTTTPLPVNGEYKDPNGRFKVGILKDYKVSPLAGSVLIESTDGNLAYTVLALPQTQLGVNAGVVANDALVKVAQNAFQQGEGFATSDVRSIPGGVQIDWTGNLTIGGKTQPVGGVILARQAQNSVLLLLIAATEAGGDQVLGAATALSNSLQTL